MKKEKKGHRHHHHHHRGRRHSHEHDRSGVTDGEQQVELKRFKQQVQRPVRKLY